MVFDTCSDYSYVRKAASDKIKCKSHEVTLNIRGYNGRSEGFKVYDVKHAVIESISRPGRRKAVNLVETDRICGPISREAVPLDVLNSSYLRGQGVKNKLPTLELKLLSSVNGLFLTGACIVKEQNIL